MKRKELSKMQNGEGEFKISGKLVDETTRGRVIIRESPRVHVGHLKRARDREN